MQLFRIILSSFLMAVMPFAGPAAAQTQTPPIIESDARFQPVIAENGMVASQEEVASRIGVEILKAGGNAVDAAVATGFALAVTLPRAGNIGGGGFMLVYLAAEDRTIAVDYREMAPMAAHRDMFLDAAGNVDPRQARFSPASAGVPGTVAGFVHVLEKYGTMSLHDVLQPAIKLAERGVNVSYGHAQSVLAAEQRLKQWPESAKIYFKPDGAPYRAGELWRQPDLAKSLKAIAERGRDGFYKGKVADAILATMQKYGGPMTSEDLAGYKVVERPAVSGAFHGQRVVTMPPPSSGGIHVVQMLNILEGYDLKSLGHNSAAYLNLLAEAMKYAYADRSRYLGDPDFFDVPMKKLLDKAYASRIRSKITPGRARPSTEIAPGMAQLAEGPNTTHFSVMDRFGNVVSNTYTLNLSFGSGITVEGAGFLLNNEMDDFSSKPGAPNAFGLIGGEANAIEAGKRPLSSMTPVILFKDGKPLMATGSPGGSTIITVVLQMVLNIAAFDMNIAEATAAPRIHHQWLPDALFLEPGIGADTERLLIEMGYPVQRGRILGSTQSVMHLESYFYGASDTRRPGAATVGY